MARKLSVLPDGTLGLKRMIPLTKHEATPQPAVKLSRLQQLLKTGKPKVCFVRGEGIGDVLMTLPAVHSMKHQFKHVEIHYATNIGYLEGALVKVLEGNPDIDQIISRDDLNEQDYDLVVNLHCPAIHQERIGKRPPNRIDIFAHTTGVEILDPVPRYFIKDEEVEAGREHFQRWHPDDKKILVHVNASSKRRSINPDIVWNALAELNGRYGIRSVILSHSTDHSHDSKWKSLPGGMVLAGLDIREIGGVMVHCDLVLCPDSSVLHLAGALHMPIVSLFGPTDPNARINYYEKAVAIWHGTYQPCPCWYEACPIGERCWQDVTTSEIVNACVRQMKETSKVNLDQLQPKTMGRMFKSELV